MNSNPISNDTLRTLTNVVFPVSGLDILSHSTSEATASSLDSQDLGLIPAITEILMVGLGSCGKRPLLLARSADHELLAYEAYPYYGKGEDDDQLKLRFKKIQHGLILRERKGK